MFGGLFDRAASILERRFLKNAFLPVLLFFPVAAAPTVLARPGKLDGLIHTWNSLSGTLRLLAILGYFALAWFLSAILASQWRNIIRLFEGYPLLRIGWLSRLGVAWHRDELRRVGSAGWYLPYWAYPKSADILPTRLGNIIRAAERHSYYLFRADTIIVWPRLYHIMPTEFISDVEDARASLEFLLVISLWFAGFSFTNLAVTLVTHISPGLMVGCFLGGLIAAYVSYLSALRAAVEYGEQMRAGVELYRLDLLDRLQVRRPKNVSDESEKWDQVIEFLGKNTGDGWGYRDPDTPELLLRIADSSTDDGSPAR